ncbi:MAG: 50S ribosomal protein L23 [Eubacteriales bacterium]|jgi:large subunit ribosomal protein L23
MKKMAQDIILAPVITEKSFSLMSGEKNKVRRDPKEVMKSERYKRRAAKAEAKGETIREPLPPAPVLKKYVFKVHPKATKPEIASAVEELFGVEVKDVNTVNMKRKPKRLGYRPAGYTAAWKKAIVTLKPGSKTIEFFEGMN